MPRENGQDALELIELGWQIMPLHTWAVDHCDCNKPACGSPAKHPRTMHGLKDATADQSQIIKWWGQWPAANIGVATGPASGVVVVDIDPRNGGMDSWAALIADKEFEHLGPACLTGGGGMHLYFRHPGTKVMSRSGEFADGVDVKGDGGYVVAPPSIHATGTAYSWIEGYAPWERECQEIPAWLQKLMETAVQTTAAPVADRITQGKRRSALLSLAGSMRHRNMGETAIFNALMAENAEKCEPPLETQEVARLAASAGSWEPGMAFIVPSTKPNKMNARQREAYIPNPHSFAELEGFTLPPLKWAVPGLLPQGVAMLAGAPKLGKSFWCFQLIFAVGLGEDAFEYLPVDAGDCLYLALEDGERRLQDRGKSLRPAGWPARAYYEVKWPRIDEGGREALEAWLGQHPEALLVVIDTLAIFKPDSSGKSKGDVYAEDYATIRDVKDIADQFGICILLVTHVNKGEHADWINRQTGSTGLTGSADTLIQLDRPEGKRSDETRQEAVLRMTGRDIRENSWMMTRDDNGWWRIVGDVAEFMAEKEALDVVSYMRMLWEDGYTEVTAKMLGQISNKRANTCNRMLARGASTGAIQRIRQGVYGLNQADIPRKGGQIKTSFGQEAG